jgi:hypothetical protein
MAPDGNEDAALRYRAMGENIRSVGRVLFNPPSRAKRRVKENPSYGVLTGAKIVPGGFGTVLVAAALPKGRSPAAQALLATLVDEAKQTGVVQKAIDAKNLKGVNVVTK